jgi:hypothetical protein
MTWLEMLRTHAASHPIVLLRFSEDEWGNLVDSRRGVSEFTMARPHAQLEGVKVPAPCLMLGTEGNVEKICFGLLSSKSPITTLDTRIKVSRSVEITPSSIVGIAALVTQAPHAKNFASRLQAKTPVTLLSPKLSSHLIEKLAAIQGNKGGMRAVAESLMSPKSF